MEIVWAGLLGALLALDTTALLQVLISQPLFACTLIGWVCGDVAIGMHIGLLMQLLWLADIPAGAYLVPEGNSGSIIAAILAVNLTYAHTELPHVVILLTIVYTLIFSFIGAKMVKLIRNWNVYILNRVLGDLEKGRLNAIWQMNLSALLLHFLAMFSFIIFGAYLGIILITFLLNFVPQQWDNFARYTDIAVLGAGAGLVLSLYRGMKMRAVIAFSAVIGTLIVFVF